MMTKPDTKTYYSSAGFNGRFVSIAPQSVHLKISLLQAPLYE